MHPDTVLIDDLHCEFWSVHKEPGVNLVNALAHDVETLFEGKVWCVVAVDCGRAEIASIPMASIRNLLHARLRRQTRKSSREEPHQQRVSGPQTRRVWDQYSMPLRSNKDKEKPSITVEETHQIVQVIKRRSRFLVPAPN